jgi:hypothetical protein
MLSHTHRRQFLRQTSQCAIAVIITSGPAVAAAQGPVLPDHRDPLFSLAQHLAARAAILLGVSDQASVMLASSGSSNVADLLRGGMQCELAAICHQSPTWQERRSATLNGPLLTALISVPGSERQIRIEVDAVVLSHLDLARDSSSSHFCDQMLSSGACRLQWLS